jgi:hypothetical protein
MKPMNKLKYILGFVLLAPIYSCTDFVDPAIPYNGFETGVYLRTISATPNFNFFELESANFNLTVEAVDETDGKMVQEVDVYVKRRRGAALSPEVKVTTIPGSAFGSTNESKYQRASFSITLASALQAMSFTTDDILGGDFIEFRLELLDTKNRRFTNSNLSPDVSGGAYYSSPFFYRIPVICPSNLAGTYDLETVGWCGDTYTGKVQFKAGTVAGTYTVWVDLDDGEFIEDFTFGAYDACYGGDFATGSNGLRLTDACNKLGFNSLPSSWGDTFTMLSVNVSGSVLTLEFKTSWTPEGGTVTITRTDATDWPPSTL